MFEVENIRLEKVRTLDGGILLVSIQDRHGEWRIIQKLNNINATDFLIDICPLDGWINFDEQQISS